MKKKVIIFLIVLCVFATGAIFAQVCVISTVRITGWGTNTALFENHSTEPQFVMVEVKWDNNLYSRQFGITVPAGRNVPTSNARNATTRFEPGRDTWTAPGIISSIKECF